MTNFDDFKKNIYPGRGIIMGLNEAGDLLIQVYFIMGRSESSRNRRFILENGTVRTEAIDKSKVEHPELIIYNALTSVGEFHIVSNGRQTDTIANKLDLKSALGDWEYEPDAPNFTPRISGTFNQKNLETLLSIIRKNGEIISRDIFPIPFENGIGYCLHTYMGDGNPLPSFEGSPFTVPLWGEVNEIANYFWKNLNSDNKVALVAKSIDLQTSEIKHCLINKY